jgi:penicillin-binding protein 1C
VEVGRRLVSAAARHPRRAAAIGAGVCLLGALVWLRCGPIDPAILDLSAGASTVVVDRRGVPLYEALSGDGTRSLTLTADRLPPVLVAATAAAEDHRFFSHPGIDVLAVARALRQNLAERRTVQGGSTITQQVAKLLLARHSPQPSRGYLDKTREAVLALRLEHRFGKREILAMYLNLASYGNQIVGAERASRAYFGCDASMLTPAQAAFLAGLPQRPTRFNPYRSTDLAMSRQRAVLRRMVETRLLSREQAQEANEERLSLARETRPFLAPHFVEMVLAASGGRRAPRIETTIDAGLQADIAGIIRSHRPALERHGAANVAVVVLDNLNGEWLAWEGSGDYFDAARGGAINGPVTPRQPGSTLKPFTYALAFEEGSTPATVLPDIPSHFPTAEAGVLYSPRNYDGRYRGPLLARRALAGSENVPAVALASRLGVPRILRFLSRAGFTTLEQNPSYYGLGVTLGNAEVRLDELVAAYAAFARGGEWIEPAWTRSGTDASRVRRRLVSPLSAYWTTDILSDPAAREFIFGRGGSLEFAFPVAAKTGTSQAYHDNWTIGYTRDLTVGVWVGNFDRTPLRDSTGVTGAGPIFHAVMQAAVRRAGVAQDPLQTRPIVPRPDGLEARDVCALSGMPANAWCPSRQREWLPHEEDVPCSWHHQSDEGLLTVWPAEYRQWASAQGLLPSSRPAAASIGTGSPATRPEPASRRPASPRALEIVNPPPGATYLIDPTLRREFQTLALRATADRPGRVEWKVNGVPVGAGPSDRALMWPLAPGTHKITVRDERGRTAEATIAVR